MGLPIPCYASPNGGVSLTPALTLTPALALALPPSPALPLAWSATESISSWVCPPWSPTLMSKGALARAPPVDEPEEPVEPDLVRVRARFRVRAIECEGHGS